MEPKSITQSKTVWGAVAMLISFLLSQFHVAVDAGQIETVIGQLVEAFQILSAVGGFVMVVWGRIKAEGGLKNPFGKSDD